MITRNNNSMIRNKAVERNYMKHIFWITSLSLALITVLFMLASPAQAEAPVIHAILFYSPSCPHCHKVINEGLPPLLEKYPDQLYIVGIDTYTEQGHELYEAIVNHYQIPPERLGVPTMLVGETVLVGSFEIPEHFPAIIDDGLMTGGINWPDIPEVQKLLIDEGILDSENPAEQEGAEDVAASQPEFEGDQNNLEDPSLEKQNEVATVRKEAVDPVDKASEDESSAISTSIEEAALATGQMTITERFAQDKTGNRISALLLFGMVLSMVGVGAAVLHPSIDPKPWPNWTVPLLVLIGMVVAIYMSYVELTQTEAVCGPVGDCNTVQQSSYATLFGILPIGVLGIAGYLLIGVIWFIAVKGSAKWKDFSTFVLWLLSLFGALFSIYLTFLEPFVIGATCAWCLSSAILMHLLLWSTTSPALKSWEEFRIWLSVKSNACLKT